MGWVASADGRSCSPAALRRGLTGVRPRGAGSIRRSHHRGERDRRARRPITAHMFATGVAVYDPEGVGEALRLRAIDALRHVPDVDPEALNR